jgi:HEAT repeat protein
LLSALAVAGSETEQTVIVDALTGIADPAARSALERLFGETESAALKVRITVALGAIQDGSAVPKLIELLASDLAAVRYFAVDALAASGKPHAAAPLRRLYWRASAAVRPAPGKGDRRQVVAYLAEHSLRLALVRALTRLDPQGSVREFRHAAATSAEARDSAIGLRLAEGTYELRRAAIFGLGYSGDDAASRHLVESGVLADRDFRLRATALRALGVLRAPSSAAAVEPLLDDDKAEVRWVAAKVLGRLGADVALPSLRDRLDDPHPEVRRQAVLSLGYLGDRTACPRLISLVRDDPEPAVRDAARATRAHLCRAS